jgi:hypothetical protein
LGSDLLVCLVFFPKDINLDEAKAKMLKYVEGMSEDEVNDAYSENIDNYYGSEEEWNRSKIVTTIEYFFKAVKTGSRDIAVCDTNSYKIYITGGESWGDSPTKEYDIFWSLLELPTNLLKAGSAISNP